VLNLTAWTAASASGPASLAFAEDTDNGAHTVTLKAPASVAASVDVTLPSVAGTIVGTGAETIAAASQHTARKNIGAALKGHIFGLTLSNNVTDATNDIDIAAGECASTETDPVLMVLASALTKRLDAAWAVGTNQGGLDTGSIANTTYHVWLIQRSDTGVVDALFSTSATSPTMPSGYDRKRRIGSILRVSAAIVAFTQTGDEFLRTLGIEDVNTAALGTSSVTYTLSVPLGISVLALIGGYTSNASADRAIFIRSLVQTDIAPTGSALTANSTVAAVSSIFRAQVRTNTSAQVAARSNAASTTLSLSVYGWIDTRGKDA
jgi:hypothetical protein